MEDGDQDSHTNTKELWEDDIQCSLSTANNVQDKNGNEEVVVMQDNNINIAETQKVDYACDS
jgi:hypothetical protein